MTELMLIIERVLKGRGFCLTAEMTSLFEKYTSILLDWNEKMNLTAITVPEQIAVKHFLDSLLVLSAYEMPKNAAIIDVGSGAGFPGVPLKIARPDLKLTLLDSLQKRISFLEALSTDLNLKIDLVHGRAEDCARDVLFRENFDVAVSRAVAPLNVLLELCLPFVKVGGVFVALKGSKVQEELAASGSALKTLNSEVALVKCFDLVGCEDRNIVVTKKLSKTDEKYPRTSAKIKKKPL